MRTLRKFIREELGNERVPSSWLRRSKGAKRVGRVPATVSASPPPMSTPIQPFDLSDQLEDQRQGAYNSMKDDFNASTDQLGHTLEVASSIDDMLDAVDEANIDPADIVADPTDFNSAIEKGDMERVRQMLLVGLGKWADWKLKTSEQDDYNSNSLAGHPMKHVKAGGFSMGRHG